MSATGLQHAISEHMKLDLKISIHAPICILPYQGKYTENSNLLIINLGLLTISTAERQLSLMDVRKMHAQGAREEEILKEMISQSYDEFRVSKNTRFVKTGHVFVVFENIGFNMSFERV